MFIELHGTQDDLYLVNIDNVSAVRKDKQGKTLVYFNDTENMAVEEKYETIKMEILKWQTTK